MISPLPTRRSVASMPSTPAPRPACTGNDEADPVAGLAAGLAVALLALSGCGAAQSSAGSQPAPDATGPRPHERRTLDELSCAGGRPTGVDRPVDRRDRG